MSFFEGFLRQHWEKMGKPNREQTETDPFSSLYLRIRDDADCPHAIGKVRKYFQDCNDPLIPTLEVAVALFKDKRPERRGRVRKNPPMDLPFDITIETSDLGRNLMAI